jgi:hypothetical protein
MVQIGAEQCIYGGAVEVQRLEPGSDKVVGELLSEYKSRLDPQEVITGSISVWQQGHCDQIVNLARESKMFSYAYCSMRPCAQ